MSIRREKATAAMLGVSAFESGDVVSAAQVVSILQEIERCADSPDLALVLRRAIEDADHLAGGSIKLDRWTRELVCWAGELYRKHGNEITDYLAANPEPKWQPEPKWS